MKHPKHLTEVDSREYNRQTTAGTRGVLFSFAAALCLSAAWQASAASGTWTNLSSSIWGDPTNWLNAVAADGNGATANFSTVNPTADITVSLDLMRTNTNLIFGDSDPSGSPANWILDNGGNAGNLLELAGSTPTVTVNQLGASNERALTISATIDGTNGLVKAGPGQLSLTAQNTYTNGTTVSNGIIVLSSTAATLGSNIISNPLTFYGGAISNNWGAGNQVSHNNSIVVPAGQTGTIYMGNRIRLASSGNAATITGGGTLNVVVQTTVTRDDIGSVAGAFSGIVNYVGSGGVRHFINGGTFAGFSNATVNFNGALDIQYNDNSGGNTFGYGNIAGTNTAVQIGNTSAGGAPRLVTGLLNTDASFAGRFVNTAQIIKNGTGAWSMVTPTNHTHSGSNVVGAGKWVVPTGATFSNAVSLLVSNGATLSIQCLPGFSRFVSCPLTNQNGSTNEFNFAGSVPSTTVAPLLVNGNFSPGTTTTVTIKGGIWSTGVFPLIKYTNVLGGNGFPALALGTQPARTQGYLSNDTATTSIDFVVTNTAEPLRWVVGNGTWDTSATFEWNDANGVFVAYQESNGIGDSVVFGDNGIVASGITVTLNSVLSPIGITANATNKNYTISGSGGIAGLGSITKSGAGTLTLGIGNSFSGGVNLNGGIINFSTLNNLGSSASPLTFASGTLQWASGNTADVSLHTVRLNAGDGTFDTGGNNVTFANAVGGGGSGGLNKTGAGSLTLAGANNYSGPTIVKQGTLALAAGAGISNSVSIVVSNAANLDVTASGSITLNGAVGQSLSGNGTVNGSVVAVAGSSVSPGASAGTLTLANDLTINGGTLMFDVSTTAGGTDRLVVSGNTTFSSGTVQLVPGTVLTNGTYRLMQVATTAGSPGTLLLTGFSQSGQIAFLSDATPGEIDLIVATGGTNNLFWNGTLSTWDLGSSLSWSNAATTLSSVFNQGDTVTFDDSGAGNPSVSLAGLIYPSSATPQRITVTGSTSYTMQDGSGNGSGKLIGPASINKSGSGTLTLLMVNNNTGPTVISGGTIQVGNGGTTGNLGFGNVTNNGSLVFAQPDDRSVSGAIAGSGALIQQGAAVLTLTRDSSYTGPTTISSGTLQVGTGGGTGTVGSGPITNAGTLVINRSGSLTVASGIAGTGAPNPANVVKIGTGTLTLSGVNSYEGNTYISNGIVKLGASEVIPDGGATTGWLILDGGATAAGTLDMNGFNETVNSLSGLGGTVLGRIMNNTGSATNTLTVGGTASTTFAGLIQDNSGAGGKVALVLNGAGPLNLTGASTYSGGTIIKAGTLGLGTGGQAGTASISLSNGTALNLTANGVSVFPGNDILTGPGATVSFLSANLANGLAGNFISGDSNSTNLIAGPISISTANVMQFSNFFGTVIIQDGFQLRFSSTTLTVNGGSNTTFIVGSAATLNTRNGTGQAAGSGIYLGALLGSGGTLGGAGNADGTSVYVIGGKGVDCTFSGTVAGAAPRSTFVTKVGSGTLTLDGTISHEGSTVVSNGVLKIASVNNTSASLDTSTNVVVRAGAFLDVSDRSDATLNLNNVQTLSGSGTIRGSLNAQASSIISPGDGVGILTVTNTATLASALNMELSRTNSPNIDRLVAPSIVLNSGATLTVTNIGPGLRPGDTFQLFGGPITGTFTTVTLPALAPCLNWDTSQLYALGRISVTGSVCAPSIGSLALSGNTLQLSWPSSYIGTGWQLQAQTNAINAGLGTNWATVAGSGATNQVFMPVAVTNGCVFYRMIY